MDNIPEFDFDNYRKKLDMALSRNRTNKMPINVLADKTGIHRNTINANIRENNPTVPSGATLVKIAQVLDVDVDFLINPQRTYPKLEAEQVATVTGLSKEAADRIVNLPDMQKRILSEMITNDNFPRVLSSIFFFLQSPHDVWSTDSVQILPDGTIAEHPKNIPPLLKKDYAKYAPENAFSELLNDLYNNFIDKHRPEYVIEAKKHLLRLILLEAQRNHNPHFSSGKSAEWYDDLVSKAIIEANREFFRQTRDILEKYGEKEDRIKVADIQLTRNCRLFSRGKITVEELFSSFGLNPSDINNYWGVPADVYGSNSLANMLIHYLSAAINIENLDFLEAFYKVGQETEET